MQVDMHYYGTYCLARIAGINKETSRIISYSAQFVDDNRAEEVDDHKDGGKIIAVPTAHHPANLRNRDHEDQRHIWVPFHFIPGNVGESWTERLLCRINSPMAQEMIRNNLANQNVYHAELMGISAHVYADTFAHYDFSGVSSRRNRVRGDSFKLKQSEEAVRVALGRTLSEWFSEYGEQGGLLSNIRSVISGLGEIYSGALGHGGVSTYPDFPFLQWSYIPEYPEDATRIWRDNPKTFLSACQNLHEMFEAYAKAHPSVQDPKSHRRFDQNRGRIERILATVGDKQTRAAAWKRAALNREFGFSESIPDYDAGIWQKDWVNFRKLPASDDIITTPVYRFMQAASYHRHYVMRDLLPRHGLVVV